VTSRVSVLYQFFIANRCGGAAQSARACRPLARLEAQAWRAWHLAVN